MNKSFEQVMLMVSSPQAARRALGMRYIGKHRYRQAIDVCVASLADEDDAVRAWTAWALDQIGDPETIPALADALEDWDAGVRLNACWALVHLARRHIPQLVIPDVVDILIESDSLDARKTAYLVLHHIGGEDARRAIKEHWRP